MQEQRWEEYLRLTLSYVRFRWDHKAIERELRAHMEDLCEELITEGMDMDKAVYMTVEYMGEAEEIGRALDKEHSCWLGWLWQASRVVFLCVLLFTLPTVTGFLSGIGRSAEAYFSDYPAAEGALQYTVRLGESVWMDETKITIDQVRYYDSGQMQICYTESCRMTEKTLVFSSADTDWTVWDEKGNKGSCKDARSFGGRYRKCSVVYMGLAADAERLYLDMGPKWKEIAFALSLAEKEAAE